MRPRPGSVPFVVAILAACSAFVVDVSLASAVVNADVDGTAAPDSHES
jgi:hypothetical protein